MKQFVATIGKLSIAIKLNHQTICNFIWQTENAFGAFQCPQSIDRLWNFTQSNIWSRIWIVIVISLRFTLPNVHLIRKYCGNLLPPPSALMSNRMFIRFIADRSSEKRGFSTALFQGIDDCEMKENGCSSVTASIYCMDTIVHAVPASNFLEIWKLVKSLAAELSTQWMAPLNHRRSPSWSPANQESIWEIISHEPFRFTLIITRFELKGSHLTQENCNYDSVTNSSTYQDYQSEDRVQNQYHAYRIECRGNSDFSAHLSIVIDRFAMNKNTCQLSKELFQNHGLYLALQSNTRSSTAFRIREVWYRRWLRVLKRLFMYH